MTDPRDPIAAWGEVSAMAARSTGYRTGAPSSAARRWSSIASIGVMTVALAIIVGALALRPATHPAATGPVTAVAEDGMFRLELTTPHGTYGLGDAIGPVARVTFLGPDAAVTVQHTHSQLVFQIHEVDGVRAMEGGSRFSCESTNIVKGEPLVVPFGKSGSPDDPALGFDLAWYEDPVLTLPVGTWRITATMDFHVGGCGAGSHLLSVSNLIQVVAPTGDGPVVDQADDGVFRLQLSAARRTYSPTEAIEPVATVTYLGPADQVRIYHGGQVVGWVIEEVAGSRTMGGGMTDPCIPDVVRRDAPLVVPFGKSGTIGATFDQAWFDDPVLHLPVGTWRIRAFTTISTDEAPAPSDGSFTCGTTGHSQDAAIVVTVAGVEAPSVGPSATPSPITQPSPTPSAGPVVGSKSDGVLRLDLTTPHGGSGPEDLIEPVATLTFLGPGPSVTFGHGAPTIDFRIEEIGGDRVMSGGVDTICESTDLALGRPETFAFIKGGEVGLGFDRAWFDDPTLRLPVGRWRISAVLIAYVDHCGPGADIHQLTTENVIEVVEPNGAGPSPSAAPSTPASDAMTALAIATAYETARVAGTEDAWKLLSPWSQALYESRAAYERAQADLNVLGYRRFEVAAPSRDPDVLSAAFLGPRAADLAANADPARTFLVSVRYPEVDGASGGHVNLVVAARLGSPSDWEVWLDRSATGP